MLKVKRRIVQFLWNERGDVPGWVLITLMTAALVAAIWGFTSAHLSELLQSAFDRVSGK